MSDSTSATLDDSCDDVDATATLADEVERFLFNPSNHYLINSLDIIVNSLTSVLLQSTKK